MDVAHIHRAAWFFENLVTHHVVRMEIYALVIWVLCLKNDSKAVSLGDLYSVLDFSVLCAYFWRLPRVLVTLFKRISFMLAYSWGHSPLDITS